MMREDPVGAVISGLYKIEKAKRNKPVRSILHGLSVNFSLQVPA